jgi:hypothetical protein
VHEFSFYKSNLEYLVLTIKPADDDTKIQQKEYTVKANWLHLVTMNTSKANYICNDRNELPDEVNNQLDIFNSQLSKYVNTEECKVAILNAFPIFLFDYFGRKIVSGKEESC